MLTVIRISKAYPSVKALYTEAVYRDQKQKIYSRIAKISSDLADTFVAKLEMTSKARIPHSRSCLGNYPRRGSNQLKS